MHLLTLPVDPSKQLLQQSRNILAALEKSQVKYTISTVLRGPYKPPVLYTPDQTPLFNYTSILKYLVDPVEGDYNWTNESEHTIQVPESVQQKIEQLLELHTSIKKQRVVYDALTYTPFTSSVPVTDRKNVLVTSALPYVNNVPHLGNIIGCVLSADVFARWSRLRGDNVMYICGTDEYGTATEVKALQEGITCMELCDKYHALHAQIYKQFEIDFDKFGRTTTPKHTEISQGIFTKIYNNGLFQKQTMQQLYCEKDQRFLSDRYVGGQCPLCGYEDARGDQCDSCGKLLNASDLIDPTCKICSTVPVVKDSQHLFLDLPQLQPKIVEFCDKSMEDGNWSNNGKQITHSWLKEPLKMRCITRDLKFGTTVPLEEFKDKVFYVWFDAPIGYISITANHTDDYMQWWKPKNKDVKLYQFMGKDNVTFHTVIFPGVLFGTGDSDWNMLHHLSTCDYLNYEGGKFSKSRNVGVFGDQAVECGIPMSILRFYLMSNRPETGDSIFSWKELQMKANGELLANLGNFCNRTLKFVQAKYGSLLPQPSAFGDAENTFISKVTELIKLYNENMSLTKQRNGIKLILEISALGNQYLQESKLDNNLLVNDKNKADTVVYLCVNLIKVLGTLASPFMPSTADAIDRQLNVEPSVMPAEFKFYMKPKHRIGTPEPLFQRIDDALIESLIKKFGGTSAAASSTQVKGSTVKKGSKK